VGEYTQCPVTHQGEAESLDRGAPSGRPSRQEPVGKPEEHPPGRSKQQKADDHPKPLDSPTDHFVTLGLSGGGPKRPFLVNGSLNDWLGGERVKDSGCKSREKPGNQRG
jgi:hypothetical protein